MKIIIDADACPNVKEIIKLGEKYSKEVLIVCDDSHIIKSDYARVIICETGYQSADMYIVNNINNNDLVITQDYGVAVIALSKTNNVIHPNGFNYKDNIDSMLELRHMNAKLRRNGAYTKGPKKRTKNDSVKLLNLVEEIIKN